ncbi:hypothetical protein M0802_013806, partial [Mischocyttarus mexicanus]
FIKQENTVFQRDVRSSGNYLGGGNITDGGGFGGMLMVMTKYMKQELASDAEEEGLVPTLPGRFTSMRKVPSLSDLSDPESSLDFYDTHRVSVDRIARCQFTLRNVLCKYPIVPDDNDDDDDYYYDDNDIDVATVVVVVMVKEVYLFLERSPASALVTKGDVGQE